jgi:hypothetical protein
LWDLFEVLGILFHFMDLCLKLEFKIFEIIYQYLRYLED